MSGATFLPCPTCGAASGEPCRRQDGGDAARSHGTRKKPVTCGTHAGYLRHRSASETACDICKQAQARYMREYRSDPEVYAQTKRENAARAKALWALARRYPDDYHELLREVSA